MNAQPYIVLGGTPQGLALVRELGKAGVDLHVICHKKSNVAYHSKYGKKYLFSSVDELKTMISDIVNKSQLKPVCYVASGEVLALVLREFDELYTMCDVYAGPCSLLKQLAHKNLMYQFAQSKGFKVANFRTLDNYKDDDLRFPIVVKRNYEVPLFFKVAYVDNKDELEKLKERIPKNLYPDILLQEKINIEAGHLIEISCQACFVDSKPCGFLLTSQLRRAKKGLTSYIEELDNDSVTEMVKQLATNFMQDTHYSGFAEFEFMYDKSCGDLYFIEVNTRTCGLQSSMHYKFGNIRELILAPNKYIQLQPSVEKLRWMNIGRDIKVRIQNKDFKHLTNIFGAKFDIFRWSDIKPFFTQFF